MKTKKLLAALLSSAMVLGTMAVPVFAANGVAKIGSTNYSTLEAAFAAAKDGDTITVLADCAGNGIKAPQGNFATGLTVDFGGHTYTVDGETVGSTGTETNGFQLLKDNKITFKNGTITSEKAKILVQNYSNLTLEGMTLTMNNTSYSGAYTLSNNNGNVVINDTTINANPAGAFAFDVCRYSSYPSVHVTVTGNSQINGNVEVSASKSDAKDGFSLDFASGNLTGSIVIDSTAKTAMETTPEKASVIKADTVTSLSVAKIGSTNYGTLEAAVAAANDGETIKVLKDCAGNGIKAPQGKFASGLTVDFDGHTYTVDGDTVGSTGTETNGFQLLKDNKITFKNGTITSEKAKILVQNYSNLTLDKMTLTLNNASYASAYTLSNNNGNVVINATTINANPAGGFAFDVCRFSSYPSVKVTVKGDSQINGDIEVDAGNGDAKNGFSLNLESGNFTGTINPTQNAKTAMTNTPDKASIKISGGTFSTDPQEYLALGRSAAKDGTNYNVNKVTSANLTEQLNAVVDQLGENDVYTAKSKVNGDTYDQVSAALISGGADNKVFHIVTSDNTVVGDVTLNNITGGTVITGEGYFLCGLIITDIPADKFVTVTVD